MALPQPLPALRGTLRSRPALRPSATCRPPRLSRRPRHRTPNAAS
jgi:hypothetical protein